MKTFLFAHNPKNWPWENLSNAIRDIKEKGSRLEKWSVRSYKQVSVGDRAFLIRPWKQDTKQRNCRFWVHYNCPLPIGTLE